MLLAANIECHTLAVAVAPSSADANDDDSHVDDAGHESFCLLFLLFMLSLPMRPLVATIVVSFNSF